jgi:uncharacterized 2Fe-2S/4Fe-4S cluster protein (DUF4445 family)
VGKKERKKEGIIIIPAATVVGIAVNEECGGRDCLLCNWEFRCGEFVKNL